MIPKIFKRWACFAVMLCLLIVPGVFWLGGWNFERNDTGIGCVICTVIAIAFSVSVILSIGYESPKSNDS